MFIRFWELATNVIRCRFSPHRDSGCGPSVCEKRDREIRPRGLRANAINFAIVRIGDFILNVSRSERDFREGRHARCHRVDLSEMPPMTFTSPIIFALFFTGSKGRGSLAGMRDVRVNYHKSLWEMSWLIPCEGWTHPGTLPLKMNEVGRSRLRPADIWYYSSEGLWITSLIK